ncbi:arrestin [Zalerion maritima]|uniref:Arrestin n=1 Tax=Zalerion maritima TaxID=339359 RepID=A0AAD5S1G1_9PEZI|nr:arrestin [Zalerion maritima]
MVSSLATVSDSSTASSTHARKLVATRPATRIVLDNHYSSKVYGSSSPVSGKVVVEPEYDMSFDTIQVLLMGVSKTETDSTAGPISRQHLFLKLQMPIPEDDMPVPRIFERGNRYKFPFNFVVPSYLTINACSHHVNSDHVRDSHLLVPPTMGSWEKDDMTPNMARVEYDIRVRILREPIQPGGKPIKLCEASQSINVLPASYEEAPLSICKDDKAYRMARTKSIRKGMFGSKIGDVTMTASQPGPIVLGPDGRRACETKAHVKFCFNPTAADSLPPKITAVSTKLVAHTYYSNDGFDKFPNIGEWNLEFGQHRRGEYYTSVHLPGGDKSTPKLKWKQQLAAHARRDSGYGTESERDQSPRNSITDMRRKSSGSSPIFHTSHLNVPITLPTNKKTFIPTFHSCITSRTYVLRVSVTLTSGSSNTNLSLALPLQIAVESPDAHHAGSLGLPSWEEAIQQEEAMAADEMFVPRAMRAPEVQFYQSRGELPGYDELARTRPLAAF